MMLYTGLPGKKYLHKSNKNGSILIVLLFMMLLFFTASSLLFFTIAHSRIVRARNFKSFHTAALRKDLIGYLHTFREELVPDKLKNFQFPESEYFTSEYFPIKETDAGHVVTPSFVFYHFPDLDIPHAQFTRTRVTTNVKIAAANINLPAGHPYRYQSEAVFDLFNGDIPLMLFPVFVQLRPGELHNEEGYFKEKGVIYSSEFNPVVSDAETELEYDGFIRGSFNIPAGEVILWPEIRRKLGFEPCEEPLEEGIYLVVEGSWIRAVFVQGDVDAIVLFTEPDNLEPVQGVRFIRSAASYEIRYKPGREYFQCPEPAIGTDKFFYQRIIVNGSIHSLEQAGDSAFCPRSRLMLLASGQVVIHSNLETTGGQMNMGSVTLANLTLAAGFGDVFKGNNETDNTPDSSAPAVVVDTQGTAKINANIIADGIIENKSSELNLEGSLYCRGIENHGKIEITHVKSADPDTGYFRVNDYKYVYRFFVSFVEEVSID